MTLEEIKRIPEVENNMCTSLIKMFVDAGADIN